jgi:hypothetical protein
MARLSYDMDLPHGRFMALWSSFAGNGTTFPPLQPDPSGTSMALATRPLCVMVPVESCTIEIRR